MDFPWGYLQIDAATQWWTSVTFEMRIWQTFCSYSGFFSLPVQPWWSQPSDPQCLFSCTRFFFSAWLSQRGKGHKSENSQAHSWSIDMRTICLSAQFTLLSSCFPLVFFTSEGARSPTTIGVTGMTLSFYQRFRNSWRDTIDISGLILMVFK